MKKLILSILILVSLSFGYNNSDMEKDYNVFRFTNFSSSEIYNLLPDYVYYLGEMTEIYISINGSHLRDLSIRFENGYKISLDAGYLRIYDENGVQIEYHSLYEEKTDYIKSIYFYLTDK